jgi:NAD(P)-dependent dehydrogenase (short-subunit alcohol dehydrogenase family)
MGQLDGKIVLITGSGAGQGRVACEIFAREGACVIGCDIDAERNEETVEILRRQGRTMTGLPGVDLTDPAQVETCVAQAAGTFGALDILYNNAGAARFGPIAEVSDEDWHATTADELDISFFVTRAA